MGERKIWGRINSISVLHDFSLRCVQQVWTFIKLFYEHEVNIAAERKPERCNTGDEEGIPSMFVCLGRRQNTPKNFLQLEIGLKILSGLGTCRMVYTPQTTCTRVWQAHQSLLPTAPFFPAWNAARLRGPSQARSPLQVHTRWKAQRGERTCSFLASTFVQPLLKTDGQAFNLYSTSCSKPGDLRLAADTGISTLAESRHRCIHRVFGGKIYRASLILLLILRHAQLSEKQQNCSGFRS